MGPREEIEAWVQTKVEVRSHGVHTLARIARQYPQSAYAGLGVLLQIKWPAL